MSDCKTDPIGHESIVVYNSVLF